MVWRLQWMAMWLTISNMCTKKCSLASCKASRAVDWKRYCCRSCNHTTSLTRRWNGNFLISRSVPIWYFLISRSATVPGLNLLGLRMWPRGLRSRLLHGLLPLPVVLKGLLLVRVMSFVVDGVTARSGDGEKYNCVIWGCAYMITSIYGNIDL